MVHILIYAHILVLLYIYIIIKWLPTYQPSLLTIIKWSAAISMINHYLIIENH